MSAPRESHWRRLALAATTVAVAALAAAAWLATRGGGETTGPLVPDRETRDRAVAELVSSAGGVWDLAADPEVVRVLQPGLDGRDHHGVAIRSNRFGLRERDYDLPKPPGVYRVVLLGDSFVYGLGAEADVRLGAVIERELNARLRGGAERVECLHVALGSWNVRAECAFLRRQLDLLEPDLVVHLTVSNDLDDTAATRGFGAMAETSHQEPEQLGLALQSTWPRVRMGVDRVGYLACGFDWESQQRFERASAQLADLAERVEARGGRYLHVGHWLFLTPIAARLMTDGIGPARSAWFPADFYRDRTNWVTPDDAHWGELGHRRAATAIYGELERRGYFEPLELDAWPDAAAAVNLFDRGAAEAAAEPAVGLLVADQPILPALTRDDLTGPHAAQIHGGVESDGTLGPFASLILARGGGRSVTATVEGLGRSELDGVRVALSVDGLERDAGSLAADGSLTLRTELGPEFDTRPFVSLRLVSDDYAYVGDDLRRLASGRLVGVAIE